ncbi:hypothetical protein [Methylibium petroleiphilum]|uniref:hypothetical protein n=1 Tax=Methylibium petroleiphilum TaxID=105560 RepID=UPI003D2B28EA
MRYPDSLGGNQPVFDSWLESYYVKPKKLKYQYKIPFVDPDIIINDPWMATGQFDWIVCTDTNVWANIEGREICVAVFTWWTKSLVRPWVCSKVLCLEFAGCDCHPDHFAWKFFLGHFKTGNMGFVTDNMIDWYEMSTRQKPILDDFYLPADVSLIYATADSADADVNQFMRGTDKVATAVLEQIHRDGLSKGPKSHWPEHVEYIRQWAPLIDVGALGYFPQFRKA